MPRRLPVAAALLTLAVLLASCGSDDAAAPEPTPTAPGPATTPGETPEVTPEPTEPAADEPPETPDAATPTPADAGEGADEVVVFFVREHESGTWVEPETHALDEPTVGVGRAAMELLVSATPRNPGLVSLAGDDAEVLDADVDGDVLTIDFAGLVPDSGLGAGYENALLQQVAHTGAQFGNIRAVRILIEGEEVETVAGHVDTGGPIEPDPSALSPITFTSHAWGAEVDTGEVTVGGEASTFEANVQLRLVGPDGETVEETFTTATAGGPERGDWTHTFALDAPGRWTVVAFEDDPSGGEGRPPFETSIELESS